MASVATRARPIALSLTGSGHLLIYQLGACKVLLENKLNIKHVAGASGGSIAATVVTQIPHLLEDYARDFMSTRGRALSLLKDALEDASTSTERDAPSLHIATTRCRDGQGHLVSFSTPILDHRRLLTSLEASCLIPPSFHPWDIFSSTPTTYPEQDGIVLEDGYAYVDGGIATPAPPTPPDCDRLVVSPVRGSSSITNRISPAQSSWSIGELRAQKDFGVQLSWQNLRTLRASAGLVSSHELMEWYQQGQEDAQHYVLSKIGNS
jgi:predicted acylesterase/phospholipase RssA